MNSWKLYDASGACSFVPHTLLEAAGATFEPLPVKLHRNEQQALVRQAQQARGADTWLSGAAFGPLDSYALALTRWGSMVGIDPRAPRRCGCSSRSGWRRIRRSRACWNVNACR